MPSFTPAASRIRSTIFSPYSVGSVLTRKSMARFFESTSFIRPSCGTRFSEMSSLEITLIRDAILSLMASGGCATSINWPSRR